MAPVAPIPPAPVPPAPPLISIPVIEKPYPSFVEVPWNFQKYLPGVISIIPVSKIIESPGTLPTALIVQLPIVKTGPVPAWPFILLSSNSITSSDGSVP